MKKLSIKNVDVISLAKYGLFLGFIFGLITSLLTIPVVIAGEVSIPRALLPLVLQPALLALGFLLSGAVFNLFGSKFGGVTISVEEK